MLEHGLLYHKYDETVHEGMRLGRNLWLDARSLAYMVENDVAEMGKTIRSTTWDRVLGILDQNGLGSCTGNAGTGALGTQPFWDQAGSHIVPNNASEAEDYAIKLYADATVIDGYPGTYPPDDTGSSGLAICKVLKARGTIRGYRWARTAYGFLRLLQRGPVLQGMPWYEAFFYPDKDGFIDANPAWKSSGIAGGHEVEAVGVELNIRNVFDSVILYTNSWGPRWGDAGRFRMRLRTYEQLRGVDIKQYVIH